MFEATFAQGKQFKMIVEAMKELVTTANFECNPSGISMQAMDSSHVSLCALLLTQEGFDHFRCDRNKSLGINLANLSKIMKCAGNDDVITLKCAEEGDSVQLVFENKTQERLSEFELKLMDIDDDRLGIPDTEYGCTVKLPSAEFSRICRDLSVLGDACKISVTKEGVQFYAKGDIGEGTVTLRERASADKPDENITIHMDEPVELNFALRYLSLFSKANQLSSEVCLSMKEDVPLMVEFRMQGVGYIRYYLAPKIDDDEEQ